METTRQNHKLLKKLKDEKFNVDDLHHYTLLLQIGLRDLQVAVVDGRENRCLYLEDNVFSSIKSVEDWLETLKHIFDNHHFLKAGFWKQVKVSIKNQKFSQVPSQLFIPESIEEYLAINTRVNTDFETLLYYKGLKSSAITSFAINTKLYNWLIDLYPHSKVGFVHQSAALIEGVLNYSQAHKYDMYLYIDRFKIHILTEKNKNIEYYNQFNIKKFSEYIRYIMLVMNGLNLDQKSSKVAIWGYIGKKSPHYQEFHKFISNISFGDRLDFLRFSYIFDEVQDHHFFDLYSIFLCE